MDQAKTPTTPTFVACALDGDHLIEKGSGGVIDPRRILSLEVFFDPQAESSDDLAQALKLSKDLSALVSYVPSQTIVSGLGLRTIQASLVSEESSVEWDLDGHLIVSGDLLATTLISAPDQKGIVAQSHAVLERISRNLESHGASLQDAVKFNIFYQGEGTVEDWTLAARVRASYFDEPGPATTGIPIPTFPDPQTLIAMQVLVIRGSRDVREHSWPDNHWDWPFHLPYKHGCRVGDVVLIGGQVPLDSQAQVVAAGDFSAQIRHSMDYIETILRDYGQQMGAIERLTAFIATDAVAAVDRATLTRQVISEYIGSERADGTVVVVPLPALAYPDMDVEIEAQARIS